MSATATAPGSSRGSHGDNTDNGCESSSSTAEVSDDGRFFLKSVSGGFDPGLFSASDLSVTITCFGLGFAPFILAIIGTVVGAVRAWALCGGGGCTGCARHRAWDVAIIVGWVAITVMPIAALALLPESYAFVQDEATWQLQYPPLEVEQGNSTATLACTFRGYTALDATIAYALADPAGALVVVGAVAHLLRGPAATAARLHRSGVPIDGVRVGARPRAAV